jgi:ankyrin repeat protein
MKCIFITLLFSFLYTLNSYANFKDDFFTYARTGNVPELDTLINDAREAGKEIDFNLKNENGDTALGLAAYFNQPEMVKFLLKFRSASGVDLESETKTGHTPLLLAVYKNNFECAKFLMNAGAKINNVGSKKYFALNLLIEKYISSNNRISVEDFAFLLIKRNADINAKIPDGSSLLHLTAMNGLDRLTKYLVANGLKINSKNNSGITPLMLAAAQGQNNLVKYFLENNAYKDLKDSNGSTALLSAINLKQVETVKTLIQFGANANIANNDGNDAYSLAAKKNLQEIFNLLVGNKSIGTPVSESLNLMNAIKDFEKNMQEFRELTARHVHNEFNDSDFKFLSPTINSKPNQELSSSSYYEFRLPSEYSCLGSDKRKIVYNLWITFNPAHWEKNNITQQYVNLSNTDYIKLVISNNADPSVPRYFPGYELYFSNENEVNDWLSRYNQLKQKALILTNTIKVNIFSGYGGEVCPK